jgi:CubicO group peptidase (beta-lactamase class C family)
MRPIIVLALVCPATWIAPAIVAADDAGDPQAINAFLKGQFATTNSCIVIGLVNERGSRVFAAGQLDNGTDGKPDGDTLFFNGSLSKTFTALLLADMADRGEVQLDDAVAKYLPASVMMPTHGGKQITLLHLATHASGLPVNPNNMVGADDRERYESYTDQMMYDYLSSCTLERDPGAAFAYSNIGMSLLGHVMALRTGTDFESLVINRIAKPLRMDSTRLTLTSAMNPRLAMGHEKSGERSPPWKLKAYAPAGCIHSSANDLLKYAAAHAGLTSPSIAATMAKTHVIRYVDTQGLPDVPGFGSLGQTAMDWVDRGAFQPPGMQLLGHAGGAGSYHAWLGFDVKMHRGVVVLSTDNDVTVEAIGWTLLQGKPLAPQNANQFERELVGIGVALAADNQQRGAGITRVFAKSPAADAGLLPGDTICKVDEQSLQGKSISDCAKLLRGNIGTKLRLQVARPEGEIRTIEVTRRKFIVTQ